MERINQRVKWILLNIKITQNDLFHESVQIAQLWLVWPVEMLKLIKATRLDRLRNELGVSAFWLLLFGRYIIFYASMIVIILLLTLYSIGMLQAHLLPIVCIEVVVNILILRVLGLVLIMVHLVVGLVIVSFDRLRALLVYPVFLIEWEADLLAEACLAWRWILRYVTSLSVGNLTLALYLVILFTWFAQMREYSRFKIEFALV